MPTATIETPPTDSASVGQPSETVTVTSDTPTEQPIDETKLEYIAGMPVHPYASKFRLLEGDELDRLAKDIAPKEEGGDNRLEESIKIYKGMVIEGRNRLAACEKAGVEPWFEDITEELTRKGVTPEEYIRRKNVLRRHDAPGEKLAYIEEIVAVQKAEANERRKRKTAAEANLPEQEKGTTNEKVGEIINESPTQVRYLRAIAKKGSANLKQAVQKKEVPVYIAAKVVDRPKAEQLESAKTLITERKAARQKQEQPQAADRSPSRTVTYPLARIKKAWVELGTAAQNSFLSYIFGPETPDDRKAELMEYIHPPVDLTAKPTPQVDGRLPSDIDYLNRRCRPKSKDFQRLKSSRDAFSNMRLPKLIEGLPAADIEAVNKAFKQDGDRVKCFRWIHRGLDTPKAIRKVKTDLEVADNAATSPKRKGRKPK